MFTDGKCNNLFVKSFKLFLREVFFIQNRFKRKRKRYGIGHVKEC